MTTSKELPKLRRLILLPKSNSLSLLSKDQLLPTPRNSITPSYSLTLRDGQGGGSDENNKEEEKMQDALSQAIVREKPNVKWSDVAGLEQAKASL